MPILAIVHSKGGVGKTSTAYNLAIELKPHRLLDQDLHKGVSVIAQLRDAPLPFNIESYATTAEMLAALKAADAAGEFVIADAGGFDSDMNQALMAVSDLIIAPCNDTLTERLGMLTFSKRVAEISRKCGRDLAVNLFVCKSNPNKKHFPRLDDAISATSNVRRMKTRISHRPDHYECHEYGHGVTEYLATRHSAAGKEIQALANEIRELMRI